MTDADTTYPDLQSRLELLSGMYQAAISQRDKAEAALAEAMSAIKHSVEVVFPALDAARADADALARTLDHACTVLEMMQVGYRLDPRDARALIVNAEEGRAALAAHGALK